MRWKLFEYPPLVELASDWKHAFSRRAAEDADLLNKQGLLTNFLTHKAYAFVVDTIIQLYFYLIFIFILLTRRKATKALIHGEPITRNYSRRCQDIAANQVKINVVKI